MSFYTDLLENISMRFNNDFIADQAVLDQIVEQFVIPDFQKIFPEIRIYALNDIDRDMTDNKLYLEDIPELIEIITPLQKSDIPTNLIPLYNVLPDTVNVITYAESVSLIALNAHMDSISYRITQPIILADDTGEYLQIDIETHWAVACKVQRLIDVETLPLHLQMAFTYFTFWKLYEWILQLQMRYLTEEQMHIMDSIVGSSALDASAYERDTTEQDIKSISLGGLSIAFDNANDREYSMQYISGAYKDLMDLKTGNNDWHQHMFDYYKKKFLITKINYFKSMNY